MSHRADVAIHQLELAQGPLAGWPKCMEYFQSREHSSPVSIILAAVDCIKPPSSRTKVYFRVPETSFESVRSVLSMAGRLPSWSPALLSDLKDLWYSVLGLRTDFPETQDLPCCDHETSGVLFYAGMKPNAISPSLKVYIPVKHYGTNDWSIANELVEYLERKGRFSYARDFLAMLTELCGHRQLKDARGMQTYVSVGLTAGELDLTSYTSPESYHSSRLRRESTSCQNDARKEASLLKDNSFYSNHESC